MDDRELLRAYVEGQSEKAFSELVARHVNFVYATALRVVGERQTAEDVVQTVFILLARKAWVVRDANALPGWLYWATYRAAIDSLRSEQRRRQRETEAMNLTEQNTDPASWKKLAPLLDEAMQQLNSKEQNAVLLRYYQGRTMRETGEALGTSEPAAQMRVSRALEKMRGHFSRRGVTVASAAIAAALTAHSAEAAPVGLAAKVAGASLTEVGGTGFGVILLKILFMSTKTKTLLAVLLVVAIAATVIFNLRYEGGNPSPSAAKLTDFNTIAKQLPVAPKPDEPPLVNLKNVTPQGSPGQPIADAAPPVAEPRKQLQTAIPDIIQLLRDKNYEAFMSNYIPLGKRKEMPPELSIAQMVEVMKQNPDADKAMLQLQNALEKIQFATPEMEDNGARAFYKLDPPVGVLTGIVLVNEDGLWYLNGGW